MIFNKIVNRTIVVLFLLQSIIYSCKDNIEIEGDTDSQAIELTISNSNPFPYELLKLSNISDSLTETSYEIAIGSTTFTARRITHDTIGIVLPFLSPNKYPIKFYLNGNLYKSEITVQKQIELTNNEEIIHNLNITVNSALNYIDSISLITSQLVTQTDRSTISALVQNFNQALAQLSDQEKLQLAHFISTNPEIFNFSYNKSNKIIDKDRLEFYNYELGVKLKRIAISSLVLVGALEFPEGAFSKAVAFASAIYLVLNAMEAGELTIQLSKEALALHEVSLKRSLNAEYDYIFSREKEYEFKPRIIRRTLYSKDLDTDNATLQQLIKYLNELTTWWEKLNTFIQQLGSIFGITDLVLSGKPANINQIHQFETDTFAVDVRKVQIANITNQLVEYEMAYKDSTIMLKFNSTSPKEELFSFDLEYTAEEKTVLKTYKSLLTLYNQPHSIEILSGNNQMGTRWQTLLQPIQVLVKDEDGNPNPGVRVFFSPIDEGNVSEIEVITNNDGIAAVYWTLGGNSTTQILKVEAFKSDGYTYLQGAPLTFTASINLPYSISVVSGNNQIGIPGQALSDSVLVIVKDINSNPMANVQVNFYPTNGGIVSNNQVLTNNVGIAGVVWTLDNNASSYNQVLEVSAFIPNTNTHLQGSPLTFAAGTYHATNLLKISGDYQEGKLDEFLAEPLVVKVTDQLGNPVAGVGVTFKANANGSYFSTMYVTTNSEGFSSSYWRLGWDEEFQTAEATATDAKGKPLNGSPMTFSFQQTCNTYSINGYEAVDIGFQTWMVKNMNVSTANSSCYDNNAENCNIYGRLYTWNDAQNVCPTGWHLPSVAEWDTLISFLNEGRIGAEAELRVRGTEFWTNGGGTNASCFSALPAGGYACSGDCQFSLLHSAAIFWTRNEETEYYATGWRLTRKSTEHKTYKYSVRCIKD